MTTIQLEPPAFTAYRLPDGRIIQVDTSAAKAAPVIDFEVSRGVVVDAVIVRDGRETLARAVAYAIDMNCGDYHAGVLSRAEWSVNRTALWDFASRRGVMARVRRLADPMLARVQS